MLDVRTCNPQDLQQFWSLNVWSHIVAHIGGLLTIREWLREYPPENQHLCNFIGANDLTKASITHNHHKEALAVPLAPYTHGWD